MRRACRAMHTSPRLKKRWRGPYIPRDLPCRAVPALWMNRGRRTGKVGTENNLVFFPPSQPNFSLARTRCHAHDGKLVPAMGPKWMLAVEPKRDHYFVIWFRKAEGARVSYERVSLRTKLHLYSKPIPSFCHDLCM